MNNKNKVLPASGSGNPEPVKKTRRPFIWTAPEVPRLADLFAGPERRQRFRAYWRKDGPLDLKDEILFSLFSHMPMRLASWLGGRICAFTWRNAKDVHQRLDKNLKIIRPDLDEAGRKARISAYFDNIGRMFTEFPLPTRLKAAGKAHLRNGEALRKLRAEGGPLIMLGLHIANWEVTSLFSHDIGVTVYTVNKPLPRAAQIRIANRVRTSIGLKLLPRGIAAARPVLRILKAGGVVSIPGDEEHEGRAMAPFFGNAPHLNGNLAIAARLARMTGAKIMIYYGERRAGGNYWAILENPTPLPSQSDPKASLLDDVIALNAAIEPLIRADIGNWYFLGYWRPDKRKRI